MKRRLLRLIGAAIAALGALSGAAIAACEGTNILSVIAPSEAKRAALRDEAAAHPNADGIFWRVEKPGTPPSHLFGTYHATDPEVATPPDAVAAALREARVLMVEVLPEEMRRMGTALQSDPGRFLEMSGATLDDFLSPSQVDAARRVFAEYGLGWEVARRFKPWFLQVQLAQPPCEVAAMSAGAQLLDMRLVAEARGAGVETLGMEGWEDAIALFEDQPVADQRRGLMLAIETAGVSEDMRRTAIDLYLDGRSMMIWEIGRAATRRVTGGGPEIERLEREFWDRAIDQRNRAFLDAAREELARGGAMLAVGALHLPGEAGLVELLRAEGFTVTRLD